jgi:hypothetical protein
VKLGKSPTNTHETFRQAFEEQSLSRTAIFFNGIDFSSPVECQLKMTNVHGDQAPVNDRKY